ncbi:MAG TPA: DUF4118 domain-containing protein [Terriglobales bacterium]
MPRWTYSLIGALCCATAAVCLTLLLDETRIEPFLPLLFLIIIVALAVRFGNLAGILGTVAAALIFELYLFEPKWSFAIANPVSKRTLILMLIVGIVLSDLFGAYAPLGSKRSPVLRDRHR